VRRAREAIAGRGFGDYVAVSLEQDRLVVRFTWMGRSLLRYAIEARGDGFRAELEEERMSPFHATFRAGFEERFGRIIADVGGRLD
jgi:hypothetical protein